MLQYPIRYYTAIEKYQQPYMERLVRELWLDHTETVLEIGCRRGTLSFQMALFADFVEATDYSNENICYCRKMQEQNQCRNVSFSDMDWRKKISGNRITGYDVVITSHIHQFSDIEKMMRMAKKRIYILSPTQDSLYYLVYHNLYEGLLSEDIILESEIHSEEDYGQSFLKLYYFGIDPDITILEDGIYVENSCMDSLAEEMISLLPVAAENRREFLKRMEKYTIETDSGIALNMKQKIALLSWERNGLL